MERVDGRSRQDYPWYLNVYVPGGDREDRMASNPPKRRIRERVKARDGAECRYCGRTDLTSNREFEADPRFLTIDHIIPLMEGGTNGVKNLVVCCRTCNRRKGSFSLERLGWAVLPPRISQIPKDALEKLGWSDAALAAQRRRIGYTGVSSRDV